MRSQEKSLIAEFEVNTSFDEQRIHTQKNLNTQPPRVVIWNTQNSIEKLKMQNILKNRFHTKEFRRFFIYIYKVGFLFFAVLLATNTCFGKSPHFGTISGSLSPLSKMEVKHHFWLGDGRRPEYWFGVVVSRHSQTLSIGRPLLSIKASCWICPSWYYEASKIITGRPILLLPTKSSIHTTGCFGKDAKVGVIVRADVSYTR